MHLEFEDEHIETSADKFAANELISQDAFTTFLSKARNDEHS